MRERTIPYITVRVIGISLADCGHSKIVSIKPDRSSVLYGAVITQALI